jgi:RNA polymerase sigma-70 factor, ECF subfamily
VADRAGFEGFYRENLARIVRACTLVLLDRSAAEDVAAEAFERLWSRWGQIHGDDHAGGYVFKTAMRLCARRAARARRELVGPIGDRTEARDEASATTDREDVRRALHGLSVRQRQAVVLRDWAGYETREVATVLGMRESTVRVHLVRGRSALRHALRVETEDRKP